MAEALLAAGRDVCGYDVSTAARKRLRRADGRALAYEITRGAMTGNAATVGFEWRQLSGPSFVISWQEADGSTVVHVDDFEGGSSLAFFTTPDGQFHRLEGKLRPLD